MSEVPDPDEYRIILSPVRYEVKLADVLFFALREHLMVFKDLTASRYVHYTMVMKGSIIDFHKTLEDQGRHIPLLRIEFDWQFLLKNVIQEARSNWKSIFQMVKTNDPRWEDLEIEFIPIQVLTELLLPVTTKGIRWNVDMKFLEKLENSLYYERLGALVAGELIIEAGFKGRGDYLVLSNGTDCFLFDKGRMSKIIEKNFELFIKDVHLSHFTLSLILFCLKIRLVNFVHSPIRCLQKEVRACARYFRSARK